MRKQGHDAAARGRAADTGQAGGELSAAAAFAALFQHSADLIFITEPEGGVLGANPAACRALRLSEAEICARGRAGLIDPTDTRLPALLEMRRRTGLVQGELRLLRGDGSVLPVALTSTLYTDARGADRTCVIARDISARLQTEAALQASHARLADLQAALDAHALVSMTDASGRITYANARFCDVSGYSAGELIGSNHRIISSGEHTPEFYADLWDTIVAGQAWHGEVCNRRKDGSLYWVDVTIFPFLDPDGLPYQYAAIRTDITERKRTEAAHAALEAQLRQAQKMDAIGTLAGGIAHDFNNLLAAILGHAALARRAGPTGGPLDESLAQIQAAGTRARSLVQRILAFARKQATDMTAQPLQPLVQEAEALLRGTLPAAVQLQTQLPPTPLTVMADANQLQQVLLNLATNAWHALPDSRGRLTIGLEAQMLPQDGPLPAGLAPGRYAHLWVSDDGCGMDAATQERLFEPFFTTKPLGRGTGLGLATVYRIVKTHLGDIRVDTAPGRGSTFHVLLPLAPRLPPQPPQTPDGPGSTAAAAMPVRGHVMYIDDDEILVLLAARLLQQAGLQATVYTDPADALAVLRAHPWAFDAIVTDYNMPGLSGLDVARTAARLAPGVPVVIGSGFVDPALTEAAHACGVHGLLHKERLVEDLVPMLHGALRAAAAVSGR